MKGKEGDRCSLNYECAQPEQSCLNYTVTDDDVTTIVAEECGKSELCNTEGEKNGIDSVIRCAAVKTIGGFATIAMAIYLTL